MYPRSDSPTDSPQQQLLFIWLLEIASNWYMPSSPKPDTANPKGHGAPTARRRTERLKSIQLCLGGRRASIAATAHAGVPGAWDAELLFTNTTLKDTHQVTSYSRTSSSPTDSLVAPACFIHDARTNLKRVAHPRLVRETMPGRCPPADIAGRHPEACVSWWH